MDFIAFVMIFIIPALAYSINLVRRRKAYARHKNFQISLGAVLLLVIIVFEVYIRLFGWRQYAAVSPYFDTILFPFLAVHIVLATATVVLWTWLIVTALKNFPHPPVPNHFSARHRKVAWLGSLLMMGTAVTGWLFYYMAFIAV